MIRKGLITTVVGTGPTAPLGNGGLGTSANLNNPTNLFLYGGYLYVTDTYSNRVN